MRIYLSSARCLLGDLESGCKAMAKEIALNVIELGAID
jgi:hypothetical protein